MSEQMSRALTQRGPASQMYETQMENLLAFVIFSPYVTAHAINTPRSEFSKKKKLLTHII